MFDGIFSAPLPRFRSSYLGLAPPYLVCVREQVFKDGI